MDFIQTQDKIENRIAIVTLNRPDEMNAVTPTMRKELINAFIGHALWLFIINRENARRVIEQELYRKTENQR